MSDIYAARGYGSRPIGFGARIGVVVVDFQRGFTDPAFPMAGAPMVDAAVAATVPLRWAAKRAGLPVIACVNGCDSTRAAPHWKRRRSSICWQARLRSNSIPASRRPNRVWC